MVRCTTCRSAIFDKRLPRLPSGALGSSTCLLFSTCVSLSVPMDSPLPIHPFLTRKMGRDTVRVMMAAALEGRKDEAPGPGEKKHPVFLCFENLKTDAADVLNPGYRHRDAGLTEGFPVAKPEERS